MPYAESPVRKTDFFQLFRRVRRILAIFREWTYSTNNIYDDRKFWESHEIHYSTKTRTCVSSDSPLSQWLEKNIDDRSEFFQEENSENSKQDSRMKNENE